MNRPIRTERVGDRIHIKFPTLSPLEFKNSVEAMKSAKAGFSKKDRAWTLPLSMDSCRLLRELYGEAIEIGDALWEWAEEETRYERQLATIAASLDGWPLERLGRRYPELAHAVSVVRPYQSSAVAFAALGRTILNADSPGLGKTTETIGGVYEADCSGPYLVVAPQTALDVVWEREIGRWVPDSRVYCLLGSRTKREALLREATESNDLSNTWVLVNIEMVQTKVQWVCPSCGASWTPDGRPKSYVVNCGHPPERVKVVREHKYPDLFKPEWGAVIADESQRQLVATTGRMTQRRMGMMCLRIREPDGMAFALSGTPMRGRSERIWGTLNWLRPQVWSRKWAWIEQYWETTEASYFGGRSVGKFRRDREEGFNAALGGVMIRRTKAEVSPQLPPKQYMGSSWFKDADPHPITNPTAVWLKMTPEQERAYKKMVKNGSADAVDAVGALAEITRMKQYASAMMKMDINGKAFPTLPSNKYDWVEQFLLEMSIIDADDIEPVGKVVIASQFSDLLRMFAVKLWENYAMDYVGITGKVVGRDRSRAVDRFNDPDSGANVMFLNTTAGGVAVTLDAADDMVILDETHVWDDQEQLEDRINNRRPEERVAQRRYWYLKSLGTIEEVIASVNAERESEGKQILDGRRGVEYVRAVYKKMGETLEA